MGFGGSDASTLVAICDRLRNNLPLTLTQRRRIRVIKGLEQYKSAPATPEMEMGHEFENRIANILPDYMEREWLLTKNASQHFQTFAHADFWNPTTETVTECKWSRVNTTEELADKHKWQLQWYYWLGAKAVTLRTVDKDDNVVSTDIVKDGDMQRTIDIAVRTLDAMWDTMDVTIDNKRLDEITPAMARLYNDVVEAKAVLDIAKANYEELSTALRNYMERDGIMEIAGDGWKAVFTPATTTTKFDSAALKKAYPKIYNMFAGTGERTGYISMKKDKEPK